MKLSISNLAFPGVDIFELAPRLVETGITGIEIAPTSLWPNAPELRAEARDFASRVSDFGLEVSGIQSLLYGHPEYQLFDRASWPNLRLHLRAMLSVAKDLGASVAVFGSPKNRVRGDMDLSDAHAVAAEFLHSITPDLENTQVILTLEPNAPDYGADYLVHYQDVIDLVALVNSSHVQPQIDTGSLIMVGDNPAQGVLDYLPAHVHVSAPGLAPPPAGIEHSEVATALRNSKYAGWVTLEMLQHGNNPVMTAIDCCRWMAGTYGNSYVE